MKVAILGSTGMLGSAVSKHFKEKNYELLSTYRDKVFEDQELVFFDALTHDFSVIDSCEYVLNCIGVIKPFMSKNLSDSIYINSIFPRKLADYCELKNIKLIHITTDCVFSGKDGNYNEDSLHDCIDEYGKSKSLGEPDNCMVIRTSIIGEEIHKNVSLISWAKSKKGQNINGFTNHIWNGITTKHYAEICEQIIANGLYEKKNFNIYSNPITKFELLELLNEKFCLNLEINKFQDLNKVDRTLISKKDLINKIIVKTIQKQIEEL